MNTHVHMGKEIVRQDQLTAVINELCETANLAEFLCMTVMRAHDLDDELSLSYGETQALISLMQSLVSRISAASGKLTDLKVKTLPKGGAS